MKRKNTPNTLVRESIAEIMPQEACLGVPEIKELLQKEKQLIYGTDYTEGNISSALYVLCSTGFLTKPKRGVYQKSPSENRSLKACDSRQTSVNSQEERNFAYEIKEISQLFEKDKNKLKEISSELFTALKNINLCNGATDQEFEELKTILDFKNALTELLERFGI